MIPLPDLVAIAPPDRRAELRRWGPVVVLALLACAVSIMTVGPLAAVAGSTAAPQAPVQRDDIDRAVEPGAKRQRGIGAAIEAAGALRTITAEGSVPSDARAARVVHLRAARVGSDSALVTVTMSSWGDPSRALAALDALVERFGSRGAVVEDLEAHGRAVALTATLDVPILERRSLRRRAQPAPPTLAEATALVASARPPVLDGVLRLERLGEDGLVLTCHSQDAAQFAEWLARFEQRSTEVLVVDAFEVEAIDDAVRVRVTFQVRSGPDGAST